MCFLTEKDNVKTSSQFLYINVCIYSRSGHFFTLRNSHLFRLLKSLRYAGVYSLQSAGEAQTDHVGYQTDTRHNRSRIWRQDYSAWFRATNSHYRTNISTYAEAAQRLHTSPPGHQTVRTHVNVYSVWIAFIALEKGNIILYHNLKFFRYMAALEDAINLAMCGLFLLFLTAMCLDALSIVTVNMSA